MTPLRRFPAGVQDFEKIRTDGFVYVDKTEYIYELPIILAMRFS